MWTRRFSSGNSPGRSSQSNHFSRAVNERLCIGEVGVDLELCVHAHGHDVDPIMEASCNNNYFLNKFHLVSVNWSFATMVPTMIVLLWFYFSDKLNYLPSVDQYTFPNPCEPERFHGSYLSGIASGKNFQQLMSFPNTRGEWKVMRWTSGSRTWTLCSCPWTRCIPYHGSFS